MACVSISCSLYLTILFSWVSGAKGTCLYFCKNVLLGGKLRFMVCEFFPLMWYIWWKINCIRWNKCVFSSGSEMLILILKGLKYLWWTSNLVSRALIYGILNCSQHEILSVKNVRQVTRPRSNLAKNSPSLSSCLHPSLCNKVRFCPNKVETNASENIAAFLWVNAVFQ